MSTFGGMSKETIFYKRLANLLSDKWGTSYAVTMTWLRCKISFELIKLATMCIRGNRSASPMGCSDNIKLAMAGASSTVYSNLIYLEVSLIFIYWVCMLFIVSVVSLLINNVLIILH